MKEQSEFSKLSWYLVLLAALVELYLAFYYLVLEPQQNDIFGYLVLIEGLFAIAGLAILDKINRRNVHFFKPKDDEFKKDSSSLIPFVVNLAIWILPQAITQIPLSIKDSYRAASIIFAAPAEEVLFRGILFGIFLVMASDMDLGLKVKIGKRELSPIELFGMLFSSIIFAAFHINYYGDVRMLFSIGITGFGLCFSYWYWRDLPASIYAHFVLNLWSVIQIYYLVAF